ncbi:MAG: hypothetical protein QGH11_12115, partial [Pirellulaceae bacterium]|nr:hypothetical protein [Pirellulaceae bacterium]
PLGTITLAPGDIEAFSYGARSGNAWYCIEQTQLTQPTDNWIFFQPLSTWVATAPWAPVALAWTTVAAAAAPDPFRNARRSKPEPGPRFFFASDIRFTLIAVVSSRSNTPVLFLTDLRRTGHSVPGL